MEALLSLCTNARSILLFPPAKPKWPIVNSLLANLPKSTKDLKLSLISDGPVVEKTVFKSNNIRTLNLLEWPNNFPLDFTLPKVETLRISTDLPAEANLIIPSLKHLHLRCASYEHSRNLPPRIIRFLFENAGLLETLILDTFESPYSDFKSGWLPIEFYNECTRLHRLVIDPVMGEPGPTTGIALPALKSVGFLMRDRGEGMTMQNFIEVWNWCRFAVPQVEEYIIYHAHENKHLKTVDQIAGYSGKLVYQCSLDGVPH
jgi:hypothetical protein